MVKALYTDKKLAVDLLCEAFDTNTSVNYIVKQDKNKKRRIQALMEYSFEMCFLFGNVFFSNDKKACALIIYPDKKKTNFRTILLDLKLIYSVIGVSGIKKTLEREKTIKSYYPDKAILHLWFIGVSIADQRKGIGEKLLSDITLKASELQRDIYLETSMPGNLIFYKRLGFEVYKEVSFAYTLYLFKRRFGI